MGQLASVLIAPCMCSLKGGEHCKESTLSFGSFRKYLCLKETSHAFPPRPPGGGLWAVEISEERLEELIAFTMKGIRLRAALDLERLNILSEATRKVRTAELGSKPMSGLTPQPTVCLLTFSRCELKSKVSVPSP